MKLGFRSDAVLRLRRLVGRRNVRAAERRFVVEGATVLGEALAAGAPVEAVYLDRAEASAAERSVADAAVRAGAQLYETDRGVLDRACDTVTPQGVAAIVSSGDVVLSALPAARRRFLVICAGIGDPGNAGAIVRTAAAAGAGAIVFGGGSVDPYNPKVVRASAGSLFHLPLVLAPDTGVVLDELGRWGVARWGTSPRGGTEHTAADFTGPVALVLGNEARGLPAGLERSIDGSVTIPMAAASESLNVAATAAILCFEVARQRRARLGPR
jgi:RNA methyltransferase, TrmH family